jgi:DNA polymerase III delta prime subunit
MSRRKSTTQTPLTLDAETGEPIPPPPASAINLHDIAAVRREMGKVYRDARAGKIDSQDGTRLVYILTQIAKLHEAEELERRVQQLEKLTHGTR